MIKLPPMIALLLYIFNPVVAYGDKATNNAGPLTTRCYQAFDSFSSAQGKKLKEVIDTLDQKGLNKLEESIASFIEFLVRSGNEPDLNEHPQLRAAKNILTLKNMSEIPEILSNVSASNPKPIDQATHMLDPLETATSPKHSLYPEKQFMPISYLQAITPQQKESAFSKHMNSIKKKEWWIKFYRRLAGKTKNVDEQTISSSIAMLEHHIKLREFGSAMRAVLDKNEFQEIFKEVELGMIAIKSISAKIVFLENFLSSKKMAELKTDNEEITSGFSSTAVPVVGLKERSIAQARLNDLKFLYVQKTNQLLNTYPLYQGLMNYLNTIVADSDCKTNCKSAVLTFLSQVGIYGLPDSVSLETTREDLLEEFGGFIPEFIFEAQYSKLLKAVQHSTLDFHHEIDRFASQPDNYLQQLDFQISRQKKSLWKWVYTGAVATSIIDFSLSKIGVRMGAMSLPIFGQVSVPGLSWLYQGHQAERAKGEHFGDLFSIYRKNIPMEKKIHALEELSLSDQNYLVSAWQETNLRGMLIEMIQKIESNDKLSKQYELFLKSLIKAKKSYLKLGGVSSSNAPGTISSMTRNAGLTITFATAVVFFTGSLTSFIGNPDDLSLLPNLIDSLGIDHIQSGARWVIDTLNNWFAGIGHEGLEVTPGDLEGIIEGINEGDEYKE